MTYLAKTLIFFTLPFLWILFFGSFFIKIINKYEFGQNIRELGPSSHYKKKGVPTMGGILIISGIFIPLVFNNMWNMNNIIFVIVIILTAIIGLSDDLIKIKKERSLGLTARHKIFLQLIIALILALYVYYYLPSAHHILIPILKQRINMGIYTIPIVILTYLATVNAVNLTDGLDGLASSITSVVAITLYIMITYFTKSSHAFLTASVAGASLGFLWYNSKPATLFMGDVGSLSLGAALTVLFSFTGLEFVLIITGGIFVIEAFSVIIQVIYFKITKGKRVFLMSPLHHHFELKGLSETKIVYRFTLAAILLSILSIIISI